MATFSFVAEVLYDANIAIVSTRDFGYSLETLLSGATPVPPSGARFNIAFEGAFQGERLAGVVSGVDYARVRADGRMELHIHGEITTADGAAVSLFCSGIARPNRETGLLELYEDVSLHSSDSRYLWLNNLPVWARGTVDIANRAIRVTGFLAPDPIESVGGHAD